MAYNYEYQPIGLKIIHDRLHENCQRACVAARWNGRIWVALLKGGHVSVAFTHLLLPSPSIRLVVFCHSSSITDIPAQKDAFLTVMSKLHHLEHDVWGELMKPCQIAMPAYTIVQNESSMILMVIRH